MPADYGLEEPVEGAKYSKQKIQKLFNASVTDIFKNQYRSPRPPYTTLQIPLQGVGDWCHPKYCPEIADSGFRSKILKEEFLRHLTEKLPFFSQLDTLLDLNLMTELKC